MAARLSVPSRSFWSRCSVRACGSLALTEVPANPPGAAQGSRCSLGCIQSPSGRGHVCSVLQAPAEAVEEI